MTIHIQICRSYNKDKWNLSIGDLEGSKNFYNFTKEDILREVNDEIEEEGKK